MVNNEQVEIIEDLKKVKTNGTRRDFVPGKELITLMMKYQGTDIKKALIEVLQNALDSDANSILVYVDQEKIIVQDDGIGMTKEVVRKYFEIIGESSKRDDNNKIGFFGIGVLQMMPYGALTIKTLDRTILVDVEKFGLSYEEIDDEEFFQGTQVVINLYKALGNWDKDYMIRQVKDVLYMPKINVVINGYELNKDVKIIKSDKQFEAFIEEGYSRLYSQGIFVENLNMFGGVSVNSKVKLELNFARNAVIDSVGKKELYAFIKLIEESIIAKKNRFSKDVGLEVVRRYMKGKISLDTIRHKEIIKTANGKSFSIEMLKAFDSVYFAAEGSRMADRAIQIGCMVIDEEYKSFFKILKDVPEFEKYRVSLRDKLPPEIMDDEKDKIIKPENLKTVIKNLAYKVYLYSVESMNENLFGKKREIKVGQSKAFDAWTDGSHYIIINKNVINKPRGFYEFITKVYFLLCHEYAHDDNSKETMQCHGADFYERFHQITKETSEAFGTFLTKNKYKTLERNASDFLEEMF